MSSLLLYNGENSTNKNQTFDWYCIHTHSTCVKLHTYSLMFVVIFTIFYIVERRTLSKHSPCSEELLTDYVLQGNTDARW
jgi:prolipoprotein diacylglyceryltransferase